MVVAVAVADLEVAAEVMLVVVVATSVEVEASALLDRDSAAAPTIIAEGCISPTWASVNTVRRSGNRRQWQDRIAALTIRQRDPLDGRNFTVR